MTITLLCLFALLVVGYLRQLPSITKKNKTGKYFGREYLIGNSIHKKLRPGDWVWVHPTETSQMRGKYLAKITTEYIKWAEGGRVELIIEAMNGYPYKAVINDYGFSRLEYAGEKPQK